MTFIGLLRGVVSFIRKPERFRLFLVLVVVIPIGLVVKFGIPGRVGGWCNRYGAAFLYEIFWILLLGLISPRTEAWIWGASVFLFTCALEFLQLWHPPALVRFRSTLYGAVLLGASFDPVDFVYYAVGSVAGTLLLLALRAPLASARGGGVRHGGRKKSRGCLAVHGKTPNSGKGLV